MHGCIEHRIFLIALGGTLAVVASGNETKSDDRDRFQELQGLAWQPVVHDACTENWRDGWTLDGLKAAVANSDEGMAFSAGPVHRDDSCHAVLWTKQSFKGDIRIDYEYTKLDDTVHNVTILYIQATGSGQGPYHRDIEQWRHLRDVPSMRLYFNHMNTYHISYAAFGVSNTDSQEDYIRARQYMPETGRGLPGTELSPEYARTGLFKKGVPHQITVIKKGNVLYMHIRNTEKALLCHFVNEKFPAITEGRIGLRHMYTRAARYRNFRVSRLADNAAATEIAWPDELVRFVPDRRNPVFRPGPAGSWDTHIRERGWILKDGDQFKMWYTGYQGDKDTRDKKVPRKLGYATSADGIVWTRHPHNPIHDDIWVEDVCVLKHQDTWYMFAELEHGAHWFTSADGIDWQRQGMVDIRDSKGKRLPATAGSTPHVFVDEDGTWVFYFQHTGGVWGARSDNPRQWTLIADRPVIEPGPGSYDGDKLASDQVFKYQGLWYMYYHGRGKPNDRDNPWGTNLAASRDGIHWIKYPGNPLWTGPTSAFLVDEGKAKRLYTTHGQVRLFWPKGSHVNREVEPNQA